MGNAKSTKYVLLRPLHYKLMLDIIDCAKTCQLTPELYAQMPSQIPARIIWLQKENLLQITPESAEKLSWAYLQAFQWHLLSQQQFEVGVQEVFVPPEELTKVATIIKQFVDPPPK